MTLDKFVRTRPEIGSLLEKKKKETISIVLFFRFFIFLSDIEVSLVDPSALWFVNIGENYFRKIIEFCDYYIVSSIKKGKITI